MRKGKEKENRKGKERGKRRVSPSAGVCGGVGEEIVSEAVHKARDRRETFSISLIRLSHIVFVLGWLSNPKTEILINLIQLFISVSVCGVLLILFFFCQYTFPLIKHTLHAI